MNYPLVQRSQRQCCPSWGRKFSVLVLQLLLLLVSSTAVIAGGLEISLAPVGSTSVPAGETRHLALTYNWPSLTTNLSNAKITVPLPAELDPNGVILQNSAHVASSNFDSGTRTITYTMIDPLPAGSSGTFQFCVRFPNGTTAPGTSSLVTATSSANGQPSNASSVTLTSTATPKVTISKSMATNPALDQKATYQIVVANSQGDGNLNLSNTVVTDTLPAGTTFVSATNGGTYDGSGHVTWNVGAVDVWTNITLRVTVRFPTGSFTEGQDVVNNVDLTATPYGGGSVSKSASVTVPIAPANPNGYSEKWASDSIASLRASFYFGLKVVNGGNVELSNYVISDELPKEFIPRYFYYGTDLYGTESASVTVEYKTTANATWTAVSGSPFTTVPGNDPYIDVNSLGLSTGEVVTAVRYSYDKLPVGYNTQWTSRVHGYMGDPVTGLDRDGNAIAPLPRDPVSNTANYSYTFNGTPTSNSVSASTKIMQVSAKPDLWKYVSKSDLQPTDVATFTTYMYNNNGSEALNDPVFTDLLSPELEYVADSYTTGNSLTGGTLEVIPNWNGTGRTLIRCKYTGQSLGVWQYGRVDFSARVKPGTAIASYSNTANMTFSNAVVNTENVGSRAGVDAQDLDGDGDTTEMLISSNATGWNCIRYAAIDSVKWVKGELDADFHRYPDVGQTNANGTFTYKLIVTNPGNVPLTDIRTMDILPFVGDHGVILTNAERESGYTPYLTTAVTAPSGITAKYSTSRNPVRSDLDSSLGDPTGGVSGSFSTTAPSDLKTVGSLLFDFGSIVLGPLESREITWSMTAPLSVVPGQVAWNSFGHRSAATDGGAAPPPSEPIKVGVTVPAAGAAKIGDLVWYDTNRNGIQDSGETGVSGILVKLCDSNGVPVNDIAGNPVTTTTDGNGRYYFGVPAGTYSVQFVLPSIYTVSPKDVTSGGATEATDSDANSAGKTGNFTVALNSENLDIDAGIYILPANLGNLVFCDANNDGIHDADGADNLPNTADDEPGIQGVVVTLCDASGTPVDNPNITGTQDYTATTDTNGLYHFVNLLPGSYTVKIANPPTSKPNSSANTDTADNNQDDDDNGTQASSGAAITSPVIVLSPDETDDTVDFGLVAPAKANLGNLVFCDRNNDGIHDADGADNLPGTADDEPGIEGVVLTLCDASGTPVDNPNVTGTQDYTVTTDSNGQYNFLNLTAGSYTVKISTPPSSKPNVSTSVDTADNGEDNDNNGSQSAPGGVVTSPVIVLVPGETDDTVDFGFVAPPGAALGNLVFCDTNNDGMHDADGADDVLGTADDEPGIQGVLLVLYNASGLPVDNPNEPGVQNYLVSTDADGHYAFTGLAAGSYSVKINLPPSNKPNASSVVDTNDNGQDDDNNGSQSTPGGAITSPLIVLTAGETDDTVDFGLVAPPLASLGDLVFCDTNNDGIRDADGADNILGTADDEPGIQGVSLTLCDEQGNPVDDPNQAGAQDYVVSTDKDGHYAFTGLTAGNYTVKIVTPPTNKPSSSTPTDTADNNQEDDDNGIQTTPGGSIISPVITLSAGETDNTVDFGLWQPASLGNVVFCDINNDGIRDQDGVDDVLGTADDEVGIQDVTLTLCDASGIPLDNPNVAGVQIYSVTTDSTGAYNFTGLLAGSYTVKIVTPPSSKPTSSTNTSALDDNVDNDDNGSQVISGGTITSPVIVLGNGETDNTVDFGLVPPPPAALGNLVFCDTNNDGIYDADGADDIVGTEDDEPGILGVVVTLCNSAGTPVDDPNTTGTQDYQVTTDSDGHYAFTGLAAGTYTVKIAQPPVNKPNSSSNTDPVDNNEDNDDNGAQTAPGGSIISPVITLVAGETDNTVDFGLWQPGSIGNIVFCDYNNDGVRDADGADNILGNSDDEVGIPDVSLTLCNDQGDAVDNPNLPGQQDYVVTTDSNGLYSFVGLTPGDYIVKIKTPPTNKPNVSQVTEISDNNVDNDNNGFQFFPGSSIVSPTIHISPGENEPTIDFGLVTLKPNNWAAWQSLYPLGGQNGPSQNPDGDIYDNLQEYAFCKDPSSGVNTQCPFEVVMTSEGQINAIVNTVSGIQDVTYTLEYISDLSLSGLNGAGWTPVTTIVPTIVDDGHGIITRTYANLESIPALANGKGFVRVKLDLAGPATTTRTYAAGWMDRIITGACETYSNAFLECEVFSGVVDGNTANTLDITTAVGTGDFGSALTSGRNYYVEVVSGAYVGHRWTVINAASTAQEIALGTGTRALVAGDLVGSSVIVHEAKTIGGLFPPQLYLAGSTPNNSDKVLMYDPNSVAKWSVYYLADNTAGGLGIHWVKQGDNTLASQDNLALDAAQGIYIHHRGAAINTTQIGHVRQTPLAFPLSAGQNLVGGAAPLDQSYADRIMVWNGTNFSGFTGNVDPVRSDNVLFWKGDTTLNAENYTTHWLVNAGFSPYRRWSLQGDNTLGSQDINKVFKATRASFYKSLSGNSSYLLPAGWTP